MSGITCGASRAPAYTPESYEREMRMYRHKTAIRESHIPRSYHDEDDVTILEARVAYLEKVNAQLVEDARKNEELYRTVLKIRELSNNALWDEPRRASYNLWNDALSDGRPYSRAKNQPGSISESFGDLFAGEEYDIPYDPMNSLIKIKIPDMGILGGGGGGGEAQKYANTSSSSSPSLDGYGSDNNV